jgi:electron transfer flavoprotein beta subunit
MKELEIIVFAKQVPDPEGPADAFEVNSETKRVIPVGVPPVINPFDENALEAAIRIKDQRSAKVKVISLGGQLARPVLRKALAAGADDLILLEDPHFKDLDDLSTAYVLASTVKQMESYDLILAGRQAGDWDFGVTGGLIAEILEVPCINLAQKVEIEDDKVLVEKLCPNGYEVVKAPMPALVTVSGEVGDLRYVSIRALQAVCSKPIRVYNAKDLEIDLGKLKAREIFNLVPASVQRECRFIEGESSQEKGKNLAVWVKNERFI